MKIWLNGTGGREQAIKCKLQEYGHKVCMVNDINVNEVDSDDIVFPTREQDLAAGLVDQITEQGKRVFGPSQLLARLESSKQYGREMMNRYGITFAKPLDLDALSDEHLGNTVIKYDGLAGGKGVVVSPDSQQLSLMIEKYGKDNLHAEQFLEGQEVSVLAFCNGERAYLMPQVQDYKNFHNDFENSPHVNTGGMGAVAPVIVLTDTEIQQVQAQMDLLVNSLDYRGILYAGLMKTSDGIYFLEFNVRFGDPETQVLMNLLDTDLLTIMQHCMNGESVDIAWKSGHSAAVVLSHYDYPASRLDVPVVLNLNREHLIQLIKSEGVQIYLSNVKDSNGILSTTGGRVMTVTCHSESLTEALEKIYSTLPKISYPGVYYRKDIGQGFLNHGVNIAPLSKLKVGVLASGNGTSLTKVLEHNPECIKVIIANRSQATVITRAYKLGIPCVVIKSNKKGIYRQVAEILGLYGVDIVVLCGYNRIVPSDIYDRFNTVNIHPSLLPRHAGLLDLTVHQSVIDSGDSYTGCTLHRVTGEIDGGEILLQHKCRVTTKQADQLKDMVQALEKDCIYDYLVMTEQKLYPDNTYPYKVDIKQADELVRELSNKIDIGGYSSDRPWSSKTVCMSADGCGTKLDMAIEHGYESQIGIDLVAMNVNDLIASGAKSDYFMDYLALGKMDKNLCNRIIDGIKRGCDIAGCELVGGETAEMKNTYILGKIDLAGFCIGHPVFQFDYKTIWQQKLFIYGLPSSGVHSNGYTLVREIYSLNSARADPQCPSIDVLMKPTRIYTELYELYECPGIEKHLFGVAHITGGGFDNIQRILPPLPTGEWKLDINIPYFSPLFQWIQRHSGLSTEQMMQTFNCGYGMVLIGTPELGDNSLICHKLVKIGELCIS